ncbi:MAG: hypothetical protein KDK96_09990, partial [Chlamydiia bacterium]|nr:hypothetical protein [Chlamydiia bacterium]
EYSPLDSPRTPVATPLLRDRQDGELSLDGFSLPPSAHRGEEEELLLGSGGLRRESSDLGQSVPVTLHAVEDGRTTHLGVGLNLDEDE